MRIVILGAPGSGKKTQTNLLAEKYHLTVVNSGELVKQALAEESERGQQLRQQQQAGQPVTDDVVLALLQERLVKDDLVNGFILDGFPRNLLQALTLDELLDELSLPLNFILLFEIETDALMERLVGRRTCRSCAMEFNIYTQPTAVEDICDLCGGRLHQRADDTEETVSNRLHVFDHLTTPLLSHYGKQSKVLRVDGEGEVERVFSRSCEAIDRFLSAKSDEVAQAELLVARSEAQSPTAGSPSSDAESSSQKKATVETKTVAKKGIKAKAKAAAGTPARAKKAVIEQPVASKKAPTAKKTAAQGAKKLAGNPSVSTGSMAKKTAKQTAVRSSAKKHTAAAKAKPAATKRGADKKTAPKSVIGKKNTGKNAVTKKSVARKAAVKKAPVTKKKVVPKSTAKKSVVNKKAAKKPIAGKPAVAKKGAGKRASGTTSKRAATRR